MKPITNFLFYITIILFIGCSQQRKESSNKTTTEEYKVKYAQGFTVEKHGEYTKIEVHNPWNTKYILQTYILVSKTSSLPDKLPKGKLIRTPIDNVVAYSTIHCSTLQELQSSNIIRGVCESEYISIASIQEGVKEGRIKDLGLANNPNVEEILVLNPEAIIASPISGQKYGNIEKSKIPIIEVVDYTEPLPLGRAEWIRFYSLFLGKEQLADSLFDVVANKYNEIKNKAKESKNRPTVLMDQRYMGVWNMPGGKSYLANMLADAGGNYIWADNNSNTFLPLSFETVLDKAGNADTWLIKYFSATDMTYTSFENEYKPYSYFKAFKSKNIWGCNTNYKNYYEDLPIHPENVLEDFAFIFNPEQFAGYTPRYFEKIK